MHTEYLTSLIFYRVYFLEPGIPYELSRPF